MRFRFSSTHRLFDAAIIALCAIAYCHALRSIAIGGFWHGPDFDQPPMTGWDCLKSGWWIYPMGWLANFVLLAGIVVLLTGRRLLACLFAMLAIGMVCIWR